MKEKGINPTIILYLENKPKVNELKKNIGFDEYEAQRTSEKRGR